MALENVYADDRRARSYADLEYPGTYYLAFRDLPELITKHVVGRRALDFGCGAGRSTRFLRDLGFDVIGVDVSERSPTCDTISSRHWPVHCLRVDGS